MKVIGYVRSILLFSTQVVSLGGAFAADKARVIEADVCIYGGTSGGVAAAVQASRMGKMVVIAEPGKHLGGMTSGGLSAVDIGDPRTVGGIAREYFTRLVATYGKTLAWDRPFESKGGGPATGGAYSIEPHVAERVFDEMAREAKVGVHFAARLVSAKKEGARIVELVTDDGTVFRAKMFIDATYEGDLMAKAGVTYTLMREGNAKYGETYNGIHYDPKYLPRTNHQKPGPTGRVPGGQGVWDRDLPLDPYVVPGGPASGLLPLINAGDPGTPGEPAPGVQAYCFRLCLSKSAHRIPIARPPGYDPKRYELVARFIEGCLKIGDDMDLRWFSKHDALPNAKWDFNTATFGGNLPGASWEWPEATYARREQIAKEHENYHRGLLHFLATDERVPEKVRDEMRRFGLPRDEFTDNGGWPHQLYIREARRMVSDLVVTEHHTFGKTIAPHPVSLGSYGTDTHEIRRIVKDGVVAREGKTAGGRDGAGPYPIGYGAIVPRQSECENLFVTFALSASHTAFSSIRMEPVFMCTSQSAATAACMSIDDKVVVQKVEYPKVRARLIADGQIVEWPPRVDAATLIQQAGTAEDDRERQAILEKLAALPTLDATGRAEAQALAEFVRQWNEGGLKFYSSQYRGKPVKEVGNYDFKVAPDSPLHPLTAIYRGRILAWNLIENSTVRSSPELGPWFHREATKSFQAAAAAFPKNRIPAMYLGQPIQWPKDYPVLAGAPEWAVLQREQLDRLRDIIVWWIDHRQKSDGQFGGGWGDDCEMWRWWSSVLLGFDDPKITAAQLRFSKAAVARPHLQGGFNTEITDVEHAAEDTTDNLVPLMLLEPHEARWQNWALSLGDFMRDVWTARNERGQLQFKSFYFSASGVSPAPTRAFDVIADVGALHPALLAWQRTGDPKLGALLTAWLDTWVDATARAENGKPAGILPASIRWPDGSAAGSGENWWEPIKPGGYMHSYYIWPSVITEMTDAMVVAYLATKDEKFLAPIRSMAAIRLRHLTHPPAESPKPGSEAWCAAQLAPRPNANSNTGGLVKTVARLKALTGTAEFDELLAREGSEFVIRTDAAGRRELDAALRESAEALRVNFPGFTSEVRSTDRCMRFVQYLSRDYAFDEYRGVMQPKHELLYRMVTGDKNAPRFPQMAVRWLTPPQDIAAFVTAASTVRVEAELFHFGEKPRAMTAELRQLAPGRYRVTLLAEGQPAGGNLAPFTIERGRFALVKMELPPRQLCVLKIEPFSE